MNNKMLNTNQNIALEANNHKQLIGKKFQSLDAQTAKALETNEIKAIQGNGVDWCCLNDTEICQRDK